LTYRNQIALFSIIFVSTLLLSGCGLLESPEEPIIEWASDCEGWAQDSLNLRASLAPNFNSDEELSEFFYNIGQTGFVKCKGDRATNVDFGETFRERAGITSELIIGPEFNFLTKLERVFLDRNKLREIPNMRALTNLKHIIFLQNEISEIPAYLFSFPNLTHMNLGGNNITEIPMEIIGSSLENFNVTGNPICNVDPEILTWIAESEVYLMISDCE
jgi:hypothetical protein